MQNPYLRGNSVYLRPVEVSDAPSIQGWHNEPELRKLTGAPRLVSSLLTEEKDIKDSLEFENEVYHLECIDHVDACNDMVIALHKKMATDKHG